MSTYRLDFCSQCCYGVYCQVPHGEDNVIARVRDCWNNIVTCLVYGSVHRFKCSNVTHCNTEESLPLRVGMRFNFYGMTLLLGYVSLASKPHVISSLVTQLQMPGLMRFEPCKCNMYAHEACACKSRNYTKKSPTFLYQQGASVA